MGRSRQQEYFSVAFLLWLDGGQRLDESVLQEMLRQYFDGLIKTNVGRDARDKIVPTKAQVRKIKAESDDVDTYAGAIDMTDYMKMKPLRQNVLMHIKTCTDRAHIPVFFDISPRSYDDGLWTDLRRMKQQFSCID